MRRLLSVLGADVSRSLSPRLHEAASAALSLDVVYLPISCPTPESFEAKVAALATLGALGANVTIPYKLLALGLSTAADEVAREIGAVNALAFQADGTVAGRNTDGPGLLAVLARLPDERFHRVQVLGSGGAARAALWALRQRGAPEIHVCARRGAEEVAAIASARTAELAPVPGASLVISALPGALGLQDRILEAWVDLDARPLMCDLAYGGVGRESPLVAAARARDLPAFDGLEMLVEQAALSLSWWTQGDLSAIRAAMRASVSLPEDGPALTAVSAESN